MNAKRLVACVVTWLAIASAAHATTITFAPPNGLNTGDSASNAWNGLGVTFTDFYWYEDSRDTFDGYGIALGSSPGRIDFASDVPSVALDWLTILGGDQITFAAYDESNALLDMAVFHCDIADCLSSAILTGPSIAYILMIGSAGYQGISSLSFADIAQQIPEPGSIALLGMAALMLVTTRRPRSA